MKLAVVGASGRMGRAVLRVAAEEGVLVVGAAVSSGSNDLGRDAGDMAGVGHWGVELSADVASVLLGADVVVDFSTVGSLTRLAPLAARAGVAIVSGTTRLDEACENALHEASRRVPVLWAPNTSVGVHALVDLVKAAISKLGPGFDVEIVETHHRAKVDAPSGTATLLADAARAARDDLDTRATTGRSGHVGARTDGAIGVFAVRGGDVIGDHTVHLLGPGERLELTHRATSRDLFARGALRAARFVAGRAAGRYTMADVLAG